MQKEDLVGLRWVALTKKLIHRKFDRIELNLLSNQRNRKNNLKKQRRVQWNDFLIV